ncbi:MAG TPA: trypsin-like peptidase domain-containing protein [Solirubrobacterales bacterium]|nr:trypsin-like peptidase domain-containing protein [Solirubrobacterales bacterium]
MSAMAARASALLLVLGALVLGACADDDDATTTVVGPGTTTTATTSSAGDSRQLAAEAGGGAFDARAIYERAAPGVVTVISYLDGSTPSVFGGGGGEGQGSGFVISDDGEIMTNAHVVTDAATTGRQTAPLHEAKQIFVQFADQNQVEAEIVGFDPFADVALLKVEPDGLDLHPLTLGSEKDVAVGEPVAAIGSPFGQNQSLSVGVVSATDRSIQSLTDFQIDGALQTDASINPGNSGGPLLDSDGHVIGIDQQINSTSGGNEGVGFAVPIDLAERAVNQLRDHGDVSYAYAGVTTEPLYPQLADRLDIDAETGAIVTQVVDGGPADEAGLRGSDSTISFQGRNIRVGGDVITAVNGEPLVSNSDLPRIISLLDPGDVVTLDIVRDGDEQQIDIELGERPDQVQR